MTNFSNKMRILSAFLIVIFLTTSCGIYKPVDARKVPVQGDQRARKAIEEGRGISIGNVMKRGTTFEFSSSNPMWRASLDILDFIPLTNADYSGGVIITDWYSKSGEDYSIKITLRFLSNEIRADSIAIKIHKKICNLNQVCTVTEIESKLKNEIRDTIIKKAALIERSQKKKN